MKNSKFFLSLLFFANITFPASSMLNDSQPKAEEICLPYDDLPKVLAVKIPNSKTFLTLPLEENNQTVLHLSAAINEIDRLISLIDHLLMLSRNNIAPLIPFFTHRDAHNETPFEIARRMQHSRFILAISFHLIQHGLSTTQLEQIWQPIISKS